MIGAGAVAPLWADALTTLGALANLWRESEWALKRQRSLSWRVGDRTQHAQYPYHCEALGGIRVAANLQERISRDPNEPDSC